MITMHWQKDQQTTQNHNIVEFALERKSFYLPQAHISKTQALHLKWPFLSHIDILCE